MHPFSFTSNICWRWNFIVCIFGFLCPRMCQYSTCHTGIHREIVTGKITWGWGFLGQGRGNIRENNNRFLKKSYENLTLQKCPKIYTYRKKIERDYSMGQWVGVAQLTIIQYKIGSPLQGMGYFFLSCLSVSSHKPSPNITGYFQSYWLF